MTVDKRLLLFPDTTAILNDRLHIAGCSLADLAEQHGTPLYIYDDATMSRAAQEYQRLLKAHWPGEGRVTYAGKAYLSTEIARWTQAHRLTVDCTGLGEIGIAVSAGVPRANILVHGVNKSQADLLASIEYAGTIVVDNLTELGHLVALSQQYNLPALWLRLQPGMAVDTHQYTQTGHEDSKFGMDYEQALLAAETCARHKLPLQGIHFHQGSQFRDAEPLAHGIERALDLAAAIGLGQDWHLSPGGGWGVSYHEDDLPHPSLEQYVRFVSEYTLMGCRARALPLPCLHIEPGRSLVARAGVAVYHAGVIKRTPHRTWLLVDGGMADNIRHALYGARYSALPVVAPGRPMTDRVSLAGPFCESGDVIIEDLPFAHITEGELVAIPMAGAYHLSMSSNYNGARRPAVLMAREGKVRLIQRRETLEDLMRRDA